MTTVRELNELLQLDDEAFVDTHEASAVVGLAYESLVWYRKRKPVLSPKFYRIGAKIVRYKMGDLRKFRNGDPSGHHVPPTVTEG